MEGQTMHPTVLTSLARGSRLTRARPANGASGLNQHQGADRAQERNVAQRDKEIELANLSQNSYDSHANG
jgi:hypothetical protein